MSLNPKIEKMLPDLFPLHTFGVEEARRIYDERVKKYSKDNSDIDMSSIEHRTIKTKKRETPIIVHKPETEGTHPVLVYMHGGGFIFGHAWQFDVFCNKISKEANCVVINIDYGLAPEHKFPEPVEECYEVIKWIKDNSENLNIDQNRIAVAGDSAGANLSAVLSILAKERKEFSICYQALIYPPLDLASDPFIRNAGSVRAEVEKWFNDNYLMTPEDGKSFMASPVLAENLKGVADALIITGECDPLIAEDTTYAKMLIDAGVNVSIQKFDGMIHGFISYNAVLEDAVGAEDLVCKRLKEAFNK